ncbi:septal ring lytic transglycosylase RlpA family protein [Mariprofundus erugo]|uniref:Endolytic peptidoglycan transglycosylase RlpA n=1 Tax=Mariprofundus erugo TaxID=2528639 RepID=A0A5R9GT44_9PROT|nr:septal ring lytic transglycosylase RlpA family protein [Mariprofundus erugo]TLS67613.1 septal ring lytic transglycosylase RlpA family protein [Mariprofundus erugo]
MPALLSIALLAGCAKPVDRESPVVPTADTPRLPDGKGGVRKTGNPYMVDGRWYNPIQQADVSYDETGIASWYGRDFHGKATANGEQYDMHSLSAAHKTLPLPTLVRVTNLDNGRSLIVRVNDRGPFVKDRLIDLSYAAAKELAFDKQGTARVRVQTLDIPATAPLPPANIAVTPPVRPAPPQPQPPAATGNIFVQLGSFSSQENARRQQAMLLPRHPETRLMPFKAADKTFYRVRLGPYNHMQMIEQTLQALKQEGFNNPMVIIE